MNAFEKARQKYERKLEKQASKPAPVEIPEQKEELRPAPKVETPKKQGPMVVTVSGPANLTFEIEYAGALLSSQQTPQALREILSKQLAALGRVTCL
jgi:hypothetical protein